MTAGHDRSEIGTYSGLAADIAPAGAIHSLWLDTACPAPITHRMEGNLEVDVAIVGGGYTGLSSALQTAETVDGTQRHLCTRGVFRMVAVVGDDCSAGWSLPPLDASHKPMLPGEVRMVDIVFADQANSSGRMFGGDALSFMTKGAFVAASRYSRCLTVLASSERIDFRHPIALGSIVEVVARVIGSGRTSMRVRVELWSEELLSGARQLTASGEFAMVAVDAERRPVNFIPSHLGTRPS